MRVRPATQKDADAICLIMNAMIQDTLNTFTTKLRDPASVVDDMAQRGAGFLVAEDQGQVVGFATYGPFRNGPGYSHTQEHSIQLSAEARGRGVGRALMMQLEQVAQDRGVHILVAGISAPNQAAIQFHRALGYTEVGRMPEVGFKWGEWLDLVLMQKNLVAVEKAAPDTSEKCS
ncbi:GNAT family N-acetyltransferase [Phaeobacter gallaeciensis]|uniref:GNAT family N-acetyltransferase n=2 Tax=Roseobacteraceae TaxID=2854170 RepID=A0A366X3V7_9RHOB|nr:MULTISPECIES: GNAT family N-acetyltransferase [Roseobacteraceae]MBT3139451.1 GNAT family N-acetyltransferase [Falsiruegeria litorea]MBT8166995.1 GNAT family N-acetyltransferase [Falsiruegeria litorea]RBW57345.1 GNAT family N-acetyltransferase [Phaeobacter gallaeciensis]